MKKRIFLKIFSLFIFGIIFNPNIKKFIKNKVFKRRAGNRYWLLADKDLKNTYF